MKFFFAFSSTLLLILIVFAAPAIYAQTGSTTIPKDSAHINYYKFGASIAIPAAASAVLMPYLKGAWWQEQAKPFHLDHGRDLKYAVNLDKCGHFYGGNSIADMYYYILKWTGFNEKQSQLIGAAGSVAAQALVEIRDGYAPRWGFSLYDVASGTAGAGFFLLQKNNRFVSNFDIKFSYYQRTQRYFNINPHGHWLDDYINQTYWLSVKMHRYMPHEIWPRFLNIALGASLDETVDGLGAGNWEWYLALDYDMMEILRKQKSPLLRDLKHYINYIKFPAPSIRISQGLKAYPLYF